MYVDQNLTRVSVVFVVLTTCRGLSLKRIYIFIFFFFRYRTGVVADCFKFCWCYTCQAHTDVSSFSSSSGIEQESLPTVSSSVGARNVRHTQMQSPSLFTSKTFHMFTIKTIYMRSTVYQLAGLTPMFQVSPKLLDGSCSNCAGWQEVPVSDCSLEEGIPVCIYMITLLKKYAPLYLSLRHIYY